MTTLRIGTRGSDLARTQTRWVMDRLRERHPSIAVEEVIIKTHGDVAVSQRFDADWPVGGFVGAIERALVGGEIDLAVHSYKDLQTAVTPGLVIAAVPEREATHDVLITRDAHVDVDHLPPGFRVGTSSPRRAAQLRRLGDVEIVPIRGNVATRLGKVGRDGLDGVVLAAAGLNRLGLAPPYRIDLPTDRFVPAPAQGALAVQTRRNDPAESIVSVLDHAASRSCVDAERSFLSAVGAGCHTPVGALARVDHGTIELHGRLFDDEGEHMVESIDRGDNPGAVGKRLADRLLVELKGSA